MQPSPYLLIFRDAPSENYQSLSLEQRQVLMQRWNAWYDALDRQGKVQHGHPLEGDARVVSGRGGKRVVDGPFVEGKEAIAGYFFLTVADLEEATRIAQQCPSLEYGMVVEVRTVAVCCHLGARGRDARPRAAETL